MQLLGKYKKEVIRLGLLFVKSVTFDSCIMSSIVHITIDITSSQITKLKIFWNHFNFDNK